MTLPGKTYLVIPAKAGIHFAFEWKEQNKMDSRFRGNDDLKKARARNY
jgi:hypothetical protein